MIGDHTEGGLVVVLVPQVQGLLLGVAPLLIGNRPTYGPLVPTNLIVSAQSVLVFAQKSGVQTRAAPVQYDVAEFLARMGVRRTFVRAHSGCIVLQ